MEFVSFFRSAVFKKVNFLFWILLLVDWDILIMVMGFILAIVKFVWFAVLGVNFLRQLSIMGVSIVFWVQLGVWADFAVVDHR